MCVVQTVSSKVRLKKDVSRSTSLDPTGVNKSLRSFPLSLSLSLSPTPPDRPKQQKNANMELSSADYEEAFHYSPKRNYTGAIYEYSQRQNTLPSFALIPGPIGGERLFTVQLHLNGLRTIGLARTVKAARHRASENMVRRIGFRAYTFVKNFWNKICLKPSFSCVCVCVCVCVCW